MSQEQSPTNDVLLAGVFQRAAEGFQDDDDIELDADYLISAGQCRRIAAFLSAASETRELHSATNMGTDPHVAPMTHAAHMKYVKDETPVSAIAPSPTALDLLRECLREQKRWRSCQSLGACRNCVDDGVTLRLETFLKACDE